MVRYPSGEPLTVPRHVDVRRVRTMLSAATVAPPRAAPLLPLLMPAIGGAMRTPLRGLAERLVGRLPRVRAPGRGARRGLRSSARRTPRRARRGGAWSPGSDVYGLTAVMTAEGALRLAVEGGARSGALAPSEAFDPADFLDALDEHGVSRQIEPEREPAAA